MKKRISVALIPVLVMLCFSGCAMAYETSSDIHTDYEGVYITIDSVDESGDFPVLNVTWHNETDQTVTFGVGYAIEYLDEGEWKNILIYDFPIPEIACVLCPGETGVYNYTTKYFNMLREGRYRVRTEFYVPELQLGTKTTWAEFDLRNK